jgi:transaldolase
MKATGKLQPWTRPLHSRARRPNLFTKIAGTRAGPRAIDEAIFAGVPVNVTLLFFREHYIYSLDSRASGLEGAQSPNSVRSGSIRWTWGPAVASGVWNAATV